MKNIYRIIRNFLCILLNKIAGKDLYLTDPPPIEYMIMKIQLLVNLILVTSLPDDELVLQFKSGPIDCIKQGNRFFIKINGDDYPYIYFSNEQMEIYFYYADEFLSPVGLAAHTSIDFQFQLAEALDSWLSNNQKVEEQC